MLSTVWNTQRGAWSYTEKRRGRTETEAARRRGEGVKRRETSLVCDQFPKCFHSRKHPKRFTALTREEKGEGGDRGDLGRKKRVKRGESNQASNHTPK